MVINNRIRLSSSTIVSSAKQRRYIYIPNGHNDSTVDMNQCHNRVRRLSLLTLFYFCQHPPQIKEVLKYMAEAIISRRGSSGGGSSTYLRTELIVTNTNWVVPIHTGNISVRIFGGGGGYGGGYWSGGGGGGWMNNKEFNLSAGATIPISIGAGGIGNSGGTTSFGTYLSANGGESGYNGNGGNGGAGGGGRYGGKGYQFGGGGGSTRGGDGGMYGGGGGSGIWAGGGNGGTYGGGGGVSTPPDYSPTAYPGNGGTYGGDGGYGSQYGRNGINTMSISSVPSNCRGWGKGGVYTPNPSNGSSYLGGGGGGYGGNGGNGSGGGGGYGGNGGDDAGGGGGYGRSADGGNTSGGGGGYFSKGGSNAGGGGAYGEGSNDSISSGFGGGGSRGHNGGNGICIIQYY